MVFMADRHTPLDGAAKSWRTSDNVLMEQHQPFGDGLTNHKSTAKRSVPTGLFPPQEQALANEHKAKVAGYQSRDRLANGDRPPVRVHLIGPNCFNDRWVGPHFDGSKALFEKFAGFMKDHLNLDARWCMQEARHKEDRGFTANSVSRTYGIVNTNNLKQVDATIAFLQPLPKNAQMDVGTAVELGICQGLQTPSYGCTNNTRSSAERVKEAWGAPAHAGPEWTTPDRNHFEDFPGEVDNLMVGTAVVMHAAYDAPEGTEFTHLASAVAAAKQMAIDFGSVRSFSSGMDKAAKELIALSASPSRLDKLVDGEARAPHGD